MSAFLREGALFLPEAALQVGRLAPLGRDASILRECTFDQKASMGPFVRIEQATLEERSAPKLLFVGGLFATKAACVTDVILADAPRAREFARIVDYPQWTESGLALLLRLLKVSDPIPELGGDASGQVTVTLADEAAGRVFVDSHGGRVLSMKGCCESVEIKVQPEWLDCTLISPEALVADMRVIARFPVSVQNAICIALVKALGWKQSTRPTRRPLSSVEIRRTEGGEAYVLLRDVPALPRHYLRLYLSLPNNTRSVAATDWCAFIQALLSQSRSSWAWACARLATRAQ